MTTALERPWWSKPSAIAIAGLLCALLAVGLWAASAEGRTLPVCETTTSAFKIDPPATGSFTDGRLKVDLVVVSTALGQTLSWSSNIGVTRASVKGGPDANLYTYPAPKFADVGLHAPVNAKNGKYYGLSNVTFCYSSSTPTPTSTPTATPTSTPTPEPTSTPTPTPTGTATPSPTSTPTPEPSSTPVASPTGTPTPTVSASADTPKPTPGTEVKGRSITRSLPRGGAYLFGFLAIALWFLAAGTHLVNIARRSSR